MPCKGRSINLYIVICLFIMEQYYYFGCCAKHRLHEKKSSRKFHYTSFRPIPSRYLPFVVVHDSIPPYEHITNLFCFSSVLLLCKCGKVWLAKLMVALPIACSSHSCRSPLDHCHYWLYLQSGIICDAHNTGHTNKSIPMKLLKKVDARVSIEDLCGISDHQHDASSLKYTD